MYLGSKIFYPLTSQVTPCSSSKRQRSPKPIANRISIVPPPNSPRKKDQHHPRKSSLELDSSSSFTLSCNQAERFGTKPSSPSSQLFTDSESGYHQAVPKETALSALALHKHTRRLKRAVSAQTLGKEDHLSGKLETVAQPRKQRSFNRNQGVIPPLPTSRPSPSHPLSSIPLSHTSSISSSESAMIPSFEMHKCCPANIPTRKRLFSAASSICDRMVSSSSREDARSSTRVSGSSEERRSSVAFNDPFAPSAASTSSDCSSPPTTPDVAQIPVSVCTKRRHMSIDQQILSSAQLLAIEASVHGSGRLHHHDDIPDYISINVNSHVPDVMIDDGVDGVVQDVWVMGAPASPLARSFTTSRHSMIVGPTSSLTKPVIRPSTSQGALVERPVLVGAKGLSLPPRHKARPGAIVSINPDVDTLFLSPSLSPSRAHRSKSIATSRPVLPRRPSFLELADSGSGSHASTTTVASATNSFLELEQSRDSYDFSPILTT